MLHFGQGVAECLRHDGQQRGQVGANVCEQGRQFIPVVLNNDIDAAAAEKVFSLFAGSQQVNLGELRQFFDCLQ